MKPEELVSEETIQGLALDEVNKLDLKGRDKTDAMWAAVHTAEAALEELRVACVIEKSGDSTRPHHCIFVTLQGTHFGCEHPLNRAKAACHPDNCQFKQGTVLLRPPRP